MKKEILQTVETHDLFAKYSHIVLGLSGGPDSMCLFDVLCRLAKEMELSLYPVHINHQLRQGEADADQAYVEAWCAAQGYPCRTFVYDCNQIAKEKGITSEEAGREARYEAFSLVAEEIKAGGVPQQQIVIAVAQNANDQCETILFRLLRGTGVDGLSGIAYQRFDEKGYKVIRPLLDISRQQIEEYCGRRGLKPRLDHTNEEPVYTRNKIRLQLMPYLKENFNPNLLETVLRLGKSAAMDKEYLWQQASEAFQAARLEAEEEPIKGREAEGKKDLEGIVSLSIETLRKLHPAIRRRVYNKALKTAGLTNDVSAAHLEAADRLLESDNPSAVIHLPEGFAIFKVYDKLQLGKCKQESTESEGRLQALALNKAQWEQRNSREETAYAVFSFHKLEQVYGKDFIAKIHLRHREQGDFIAVFTGGAIHRKKIQDLLVDEKVPRAKREQILLAAIGREILWILPDAPGKKGRFSANYKVSGAADERIIALEYLFHI